MTFVVIMMGDTPQFTCHAGRLWRNWVGGHGESTGPLSGVTIGAVGEVEKEKNRIRTRGRFPRESKLK